MMACACTSSELEWFQKVLIWVFIHVVSLLCFVSLNRCCSESFNLYYVLCPFSIQSPLLSHHINWSWCWCWNLQSPWRYSVLPLHDGTVLTLYTLISSHCSHSYYLISPHYHFASRPFNCKLRLTGNGWMELWS